ncbi:MAG: glutaredoxin domain-containing protein [Candidatus Bathyarchaeia archaeon]
MAVYSTPDCPNCVLAKNFLRKNNVSFKDIDVSTNPKAAIELIMKAGQMAVPVIKINDKMIIGFDKVAIVNALRDSGVKLEY